jgi:hypothetical protein
MADEIQLSDLLPAEPTVQQKAAALSAALRRHMDYSQNAMMLGAPGAKEAYGGNLQLLQNVTQELEKRPQMGYMGAHQRQAEADAAAREEQLKAMQGDQGKNYAGVVGDIAAGLGHLAGLPESTQTNIRGITNPYLAKEVIGPTKVLAAANLSAQARVDAAHEAAAARFAQIKFQKDMMDRMGADPATLDILAKLYIQNGGNLRGVPLPSGMAGNIYKVMIPQRAAELMSPDGGQPQLGTPAAGGAPTGSVLPNALQPQPGAQPGLLKKTLGQIPSLAANKGQTQADTTSLAKQQAQQDLLTSWHKTVEPNMQVLERVAQKLKDTGSPLLNKPIREAARALTGDPDYKSFLFALNVVSSELGKILQGGGTGSALTDRAFREVAKGLSSDMSIDELTGVLDTARQDIRNREAGQAATVSGIQQRLQGGTNAAAGATAGGIQLSPEVKQKIQAAKDLLQSNPAHPRAAEIIARIKQLEGG